MLWASRERLEVFPGWQTLPVSRLCPIADLLDAVPSVHRLFLACGMVVVYTSIPSSRTGSSIGPAPCLFLLLVPYNRPRRRECSAEVQSLSSEDRKVLSNPSSAIDTLCDSAQLMKPLWAFIYFSLVRGETVPVSLADSYD